jgi:hypothetical protein
MITRYWFDWVKMVEMIRWPKRVIERVVDRGGGDAEAGGRVAVDLHDVGREALLGQVGRDVVDLGQLPQAVRELRDPGRQVELFALSSTNWYWVRLTRSSIVRSWIGCM